MKIKLKYLIVLIVVILIVIVANTKKETDDQILIGGATYYKVDNLDENINNGYIENIDMEYIYSDNGMGIKIDSLKISHATIEISTRFKNVDSNNIKYAFAVFDDKYNIYEYRDIKAQVSRIIEFYKRHNIKYDIHRKKYTNSNEHDISIKLNEDNTLTTVLNNEFLYKFDKGNKLYIKIWDININNSRLAGEYLIEINLPLGFYDNAGVEYKITNKVKGFKLITAFMDEKFLLVQAEVGGLYDLAKSNSGIGESKSEIYESTIKWLDARNDYFYIVDENGRRYNFKKHNSAINSDWLRVGFDINTEIATDKLYIHAFVNGKEEIVELELISK